MSVGSIALIAIAEAMPEEPLRNPISGSAIIASSKPWIGGAAALIRINDNLPHSICFGEFGDIAPTIRAGLIRVSEILVPISNVHKFLVLYLGLSLKHTLVTLKGSTCVEYDSAYMHSLVHHLVIHISRIHTKCRLQLCF
jgi:hypothetical protein